MEFCPQLSAFQGVIISADNVHSFSMLTSKGGNEDKIDYIVERISKFLEDGRFITKDGIIEEASDMLRKFALFLILNADLSVLSEITDMKEIELVIWTIPTIPKCLLCDIFWRLHFDRFVYEAISFSYPDLGLELGSAFTDSIKYLTPSECLVKVRLVSSALYRLLCRVHMFNFETILLDKLTVTFNNFQKAITYFTEPPKAERLINLKKDDLYKYIGDCLYNMLMLVNECLEHFTSVQAIEGVDPLYMLTYIGGHINKDFDYNVCDNPDQIILYCFNRCHVALLDKFQEVVMGVSVDVFCAWSEFEEDGKSVQRKIGELCHKVRTKLLSVSTVAEHPVVSMIQQISCKPIELTEIVETVTTDTIVRKIYNNDEDKIVWLRALMNKAELYQDETLMQCLQSNLELLNEGEFYDLYKNFNNYLIASNETRNELKSFIVKIFQQCNMSTKHLILVDRFKDNVFIDMETDEFDNMMTTIFNKCVASSDADLADVLGIFIQNPQKVYTNIFVLASDNNEQMKIMLRVMKLLENFSNHYYSTDTESCIIRVTQNALKNLDTEKRKDNFINFVCSLKHSNCITAPKLLLLVIMPTMHKALIEKDIDGLNTQCKLLKEAYTLNELVMYRAPMLAMLAQIMDTIRWKIGTFSSNSPATLQLALDLQVALFDTYNNEIPDNERSWLRNKLKNMQPLNMYYYRQLWNPPGSNYVEIVSGINFNASMNGDRVTGWLTEVLCCLTQQEWHIVWDSLALYKDVDILDIFHNGISLMSLAERSHRSPASWACILYCYRNLITMIRYKYFKEPLTNAQVTPVVDKIVLTCNLTEAHLLTEPSAIILPLFAYLAEKKSDYSFNICLFLRRKLKHPTLLDTFTKLFANSNV